MRRSLALLVATIALSAAPAGAREPLDLDLARLGPPTREVWLGQLPCLTPAACSAQQVADAEEMAGDARVRFGRLATDLTLAFTSALLEPASTTGHSGFQFGLESAYGGVSHGPVGSAGNLTFPAGTYGGARDSWPTRSLNPTELFTPSAHVRKALPYSVELGGRLTYLAQSSYFATQLEAKWAFVEGYTLWPDAAIRVAWTKVLGQRELDLSATEFDLLVSKRFGVNAVTSLTPYLAGRFTRMDASSKVMAFRADLPTPATEAEALAIYAAFPSVKSTLYRTTAGVRLTSFAVAMAAELSYFGGGAQGKKTPAVGDYRRYYTPASLSGAVKFGFEF